MDPTTRFIDAAELQPTGGAVEETRYLATTGEARGDPGRADAFQRLAERHLDAIGEAEMPPIPKIELAE